MSVRPFALSTLGLLAALMPALALAAPTCTLVANPPVVSPGQGFSLSLISSGGTTASINNGVGTIGVNGTKSAMSASQTTTYTATVSGSTGTTTCATTVNISQVYDPSRDGGSGGGGSGGGGGGGNPLQGIGQLLGGAGQLLNALGGSNAVNLSCQPAGNPDCGVCGMRVIDGKCRADPSDRWHCQCQNNTNGFTTVGVCQAGQCLGQSSGGGQGQLGGGMQGLGQGLQALSSIIQGLSSLMGQGGGGGGGGGDYGSGYYYPQGCTQYYYTATTTSDPCAIYQPNLVSNSFYSDLGTTGSSNSILDNLGTTQNPISSFLTNNTNQNTNTLLNSIASGQSSGQSSTSRDSLTGDVNDATVLANLRRGFSEVAGFFGGDTLSRVCRTRPWAGGSFLAGVAPDTFFDELCKKAGYAERFGGNGGTQQPSSSFNTGTTPILQQATSTSPYIPPEAEIRAEPASVRLGTRTYIFWTSQGVDSCSVTGPSFTQNTLFGAGATVPITGPTSFAISCTASDGTVVSDSVTVNLSI